MKLAYMAPVVLFLVLNVPVEGTIGGADAFGYSFIDSEQVGGPAASFEDISSTGTLAIGSNFDEGTASATLGGITFPFYGVNYTSCNMNSNGVVYFGTNVGWQNTTLPASNRPYPMIAAMWDDLGTYSGGSVRYQAFTTEPRRFIVQFNLTHYSDTSALMTFQIKMYESGLISMVYFDMPAGTYTNGNSATVGIQNSNATIGLQYEANGTPSANNLYSGLQIDWSLGNPPHAPTGALQADQAGGTAQPDMFISDAGMFFRATPTDPDPGQTVGTQVEILTLGTPFDPSLVTGQTATSPLGASGSVAEATCVFTGAPYGTGSYHWRIRSIDQFAKTSAWVTPANRTFQVDIDPPTAPLPAQPGDGQDVAVVSTNGGDVTFAWSPAADAGPAPIASYTITIARDPLCTQVVESRTVTSPTYSTFLPSSQYPLYWRVTTRDGVGNMSVPSTVSWFRAVHNDDTDHGAGDAAKACGMSATGHPGWILGLVILAASVIFLRIRL